MPAGNATSAPRSADVSRKWLWFIVLGVALIVLGIVAWLDVVAVTIAGTVFIGAMLLVGGIIQVIHAFLTREWRSFIFNLLCGVLSAIAGLLIMTEPVRGAVVLTIFVVAALIVGGIVRIVLALRHRDVARWGLLVLSGIVSLAVGILLYASLPWSGLVVVGTLIAIELVVQGVAWLSFGLALRRAG